MRIPQHVAIIMDGNGRWAQRRGHRRLFGHVRGSHRVKAIVREAHSLGIQALTLYAFSTENWTRPGGELSVLWKLLKKFLNSEVNELHRNHVRLRFIGEVERLEPELREVIKESIEKLKNNTGLQLTIAVSYGARAEMARAARLFAEDCVAGRAKPEEMSEEKLFNYLWTRELGALSEVDLLIRTGGDKRVSNFLLYQAAYAEYVFNDLCWPDFSVKELRAALVEFDSRERRFGCVDAASAPAKSAVPAALETAQWAE